MPPRHHEVPTHLDVEDRVVFGLTARQFLYLLVGSSATYALWDQVGSAAGSLRVVAAGVCVIVTLAFALLRPAGRPLEAWLLAALLYLGSPRAATWRPPEPEATDWRPLTAEWQELTPSPVWADGGQA